MAVAGRELRRSSGDTLGVASGVGCVANSAAFGTTLSPRPKSVDGACGPPLLSGPRLVVGEVRHLLPLDPQEAQKRRPTGRRTCSPQRLKAESAQSATRERSASAS